MTAATLADWLADAGLRNLPLEQMVDGFSRRLNELGVPVARTFVGMNTLHPMLRARSLIWSREAGLEAHFEFNHADIDASILQQSPFAPMVRHGIAERRYDLSTPKPAEEVPVFEELRASGMTEWLGRVFPLGELAPQLGGPGEAERVGELWLVCSLTTDRPGGYSAEDTATLRQLLPLFAVAAKATTMRAIWQGLLASYIGSDPASRLLSGAVLRGEVQGVEAVLFYADLRGFTELADTMQGKELIALLDECFDCMARPVARRGGEILKFMGDGLLAIFAVGDAVCADVCSTALDAATEALAMIDALNAARRTAGRRAAGLDIALHIGNVLYGNVGTDARLDFTVIGPAVNEASRIEFLCKSLGQNLLISRQFAEAATSCRHRLASVGRHRLRGVREEAELFTLAPGA